MESLTYNLGTLRPLLTARCTFSHNITRADGRRGVPVVYLSDEPCMPPTGRNTRQDGITFVALQGSLPFEGKWSAFDITPDNRGKVSEEDRVSITQYDENGDPLGPAQEFIVAGVTEYDEPMLGFAFSLLTLKEKEV